MLKGMYGHFLPILSVIFQLKMFVLVLYIFFTYIVMVLMYDRFASKFVSCSFVLSFFSCQFFMDKQFFIHLNQLQRLKLTWSLEVVEAKLFRRQNFLVFQLGWYIPEFKIMCFD